MHGLQQRAGIDTEFFDQPISHLPVGFESIGLPAAAVLREHQLAGDALVQRVSLHGHSEAAEQLSVPSSA